MTSRGENDRLITRSRRRYKPGVVSTPSRIKDVGQGKICSEGKHIIWHAQTNSRRKPSMPKMPWDEAGK